MDDPLAELRAVAAAERAHVTRHTTSEAVAADPWRGGVDPDAARHRRELLEAMDGVTPVRPRVSRREARALALIRNNPRRSA